MFGRIARAIFGTTNDRSIKAFQRRVPAINALEPAMAALTDEALQGRTAEFRHRLAAGETLDALLPEAFATVREASRRVWMGSCWSMARLPTGRVGARSSAASMCSRG